MLHTLFRVERQPDGLGPLAARDYLFAALGFVLAATLCWWRDLTALPLLLDNQHYFYIAERAASGVAPHVSHFDPKHALSMLVTAAAIVVGRAFDVSDLMSARAVSVCAAGAAVALTWLVARLLTGRRLPAHLAALAMLTFHRYFFMAAVGARPKVFMVPLELAAVLAVAGGRWFWAGVFSSLAFLCWQPAIIFIAAAGLVILTRTERWPALAAFAAAVLGVNVIYEAYFVYHGALAEQLEQSYFFPSVYMQSSFPPDLDIMIRRTRMIFGLRGSLAPGFVVRIAALVGIVAFWAGCVVRPRRAPRFAVEQPGWLYVMICVHAAWLLTVSNYQGYPDEFIVLPLLALLAGVTLAVPCELSPRAAPAWLRPAISLVLVLVLVTAIGKGLPRDKGSDRLRGQYRLADRVAEFLDSGLSVYASGCTHLLAFNHADNFVRYGFYFRGFDRYMRDQGFRNGHPFRNGELPDVILGSRTRFRRDHGWLGKHYDNRTPLAFDRQGISVWRRRSAARERPSPDSPATATPT